MAKPEVIYFNPLKRLAKPRQVHSWRLLSWLCLVLLLSGCSEEPQSNSEQSNSEQSNASSQAAGEGAERRTPIAVYEVSPRDLSRQITLSASVQPRYHIQINSRLQGAVDEVLVEESDQVARHQTLLQFDVQEEQAELQRAQARATESRLERQRLEQLIESRNISEAELQRAQAVAEAAQAEQLLWQTRLNFGTVQAPQAAVVTARHVEPGEVVEAQRLLFELAVMDELVVRPGVSERDIRHLRVGQPVPVQLDALPGTTIEGEIRRIFPTADTQSRLVTVEVALPADSYQQGVRPGYLARMPLLVDARPDTIAVPAASVGEDDEGRYVYVVVDDRLEQRSVDVGITRGQWTEITAGLEAGDLVLASNPIDMAAGTAVRIVGYRG